MNTSFKNKKDHKGNWAFSNLNLQRFIFPLLAIIIAFILYPHLLPSMPDYKIGDIATRDIKAAREYLIEDKSLTEYNHNEAVKSVLPVYDFDHSGGGVIAKIREAFNFARMITSTPFTKSLHPQNNSTMQENENTDGSANITVIAEETGKISSINESEFAANFFELLDIPVKIDIFHTFAANRFDMESQEYLEEIIMEVLSHGIVANFKLLLNDIEKGFLLHDLQSGVKNVVKGSRDFLGITATEGYLRAKVPILGKDTSPERAVAIVDLAISLIRPNLTFNSRETELLKEQAKKNVTPFYFKIQQGEMLVRDGDLITETNLIKLTAQKDYLQSRSVFARVPAIALLVGLMLMVMGKTDLFKSRQNTKNKDITLCAIVILSNLIIMVVMTIIADELAKAFSFLSYESLCYTIPVAIASMLISIFVGFNAAVGSAVIMAILSGFLFNISGPSSITMFVFIFTCSTLAAHEVKKFKEQDVPIKAGTKVGAIGILLVIGIKIFKGELLTLDTPWAMAAAFIGGILAGVITIGTIPIIEIIFGYATEAKLLELANLDQPLLRELMVQAPGTYHHSVIVSNMVEASAEAINANPLLAKVAAYYHDIGKTKKPLYFIENQMGQGNRHEKLEPSMSSLILISHVKDGVELAKAQKLGKEIIDIIQQHHGTSLIAYFFAKAKEQAEKKGWKSLQDMEADFRYPGPNPQTKEAGLIMLADAVEAATRSLSDYSPSRIQGMIQIIFNKIFSDGQLNECELTLKDLNEIAKSFTITLRGIFHPRIEYPSQTTKVSTAKRGANESSHNQQDGAARNKNDEKDSGETLKRLGL